MPTKLNFRLGTLLVLISAIAVCIHFWSDAPNHTLANFLRSLKSANTEIANEMLSTNLVIQQSEDRYMVLVTTEGFAGPSVSGFGTPKRWKTVSIVPESRTFADLLARRRQFKVRGILQDMPVGFEDQFLIVICGNRVTDIQILHPFFVS